MDRSSSGRPSEWKWLHDADPALAPMCRSSTGSNVPVGDIRLMRKDGNRVALRLLSSRSDYQRTCDRSGRKITRELQMNCLTDWLVSLHKSYLEDR